MCGETFGRWFPVWLYETSATRMIIEHTNGKKRNFFPPFFLFYVCFYIGDFFFFCLILNTKTKSEITNLIIYHKIIQYINFQDKYWMCSVTHQSCRGCGALPSPYSVSSWAEDSVGSLVEVSTPPEIGRAHV